MKTFFKTLRRQEGFTLVELMVVVAIIGLLSAVAIPNFQKYQARSKTAEAKLQLAAIYTAEASFFADYNIYHTCLNYMGYNPTDEVNSRYYAMGFGANASIEATAYGSATNAGINTVDCPATLNGGTAGSSFFAAGKSIGNALVTSTAFFSGTAIGSQTAATMTYVAGAAGIVHKDFTASNTASAFTIDQAKKISTMRNGY